MLDGGPTPAPPANHPQTTRKFCNGIEYSGPEKSSKNIKKMHKLIAQRYTGAVKMSSFSHLFLMLPVYLWANKEQRKKRFFHEK